MHFRFQFRWLLAALMCLLPVLPARADAPDDDFRITLTELLPELRKSYQDAQASDSLLLDNTARRQELSGIIRAADEVTVMLYTQQSEFAFDMAFALEKVSAVYASFRDQARLSDKYLIASRSGLRRYTLLGETLRDMYMSHPMDSLLVVDTLLQELTPPAPLQEVEPEEKALLDSCLYYTDALAALYGGSVLLALQDSVAYAETERRLQQAYEYAQDNYAQTQKNIFIGGSVNAVHIIRNWDAFIARVKSDMNARFRPADEAEDDETLSGRSIPRYAFLALIVLFLSFLVASILTTHINSGRLSRLVNNRRHRCSNLYLLFSDRTTKHGQVLHKDCKVVAHNDRTIDCGLHLQGTRRITLSSKRQCTAMPLNGIGVFRSHGVRAFQIDDKVVIPRLNAAILLIGKILKYQHVIAIILHASAIAQDVSTILVCYHLVAHYQQLICMRVAEVHCDLIVIVALHDKVVPSIAKWISIRITCQQLHRFSDIRRPLRTFGTTAINGLDDLDMFGSNIES